MQNPKTIYKGSDDLYYQYYENEMHYCSDPYEEDSNWIKADCSINSNINYLSQMDFYFEYTHISCPSLGDI